MSLVTLATPQLSLVAGAGQVTTAEQSPGSLLTVMSAGQVIVGFSVSFTVPEKLQEAVLP